MTKYQPPSPINRYWVAVRGIGYAIYSQRNLKIQIAMGLLAIGLGLYLDISPSEWFWLCFSIVLVLMAEMMNTAIEITVDLVTRRHRMRAMLAKDVAAGAVLVSCLFSIWIGYLIFFKRLFTLIVIRFSGG